MNVGLDLASHLGSLGSYIAYIKRQLMTKIAALFVLCHECRRVPVLGQMSRPAYLFT